jgi:sirohydrochlorin cobaltochelatase
MAGRALVLFAHGARDARWREPFDRLRERFRTTTSAKDTINTSCTTQGSGKRAAY